MTQTTATLSGRDNPGTAKSSMFSRLAIMAGIAAFGVELVLMAAGPATAGTPDRYSVYHGDLDLTSSADRIVLEQRINAAARAVCRDLVSDTIVGHRRCMAYTVAATRPQIEALAQRSRARTETAALTGRPASSR